MPVDELTPEDVRHFLAEPHLAVIATNGSDGHPHPTPAWFLPEPEGTVSVLAGCATVKVLNIGRDPRVAILISRERPPGRWVLLRGCAAVSDDPDLIEDQMLQMARRYLGDQEGIAYAAAWPRPLHFVSITIPHPVVSSWGLPSASRSHRRQDRQT